MTSEITISHHKNAHQKNWGIITLNRPDALNALTETMCLAIRDALTAWAVDDTIHAVLIEGAGEKAFCAGGDIRWLYDTSKQDAKRAAQFFRHEYWMNSLIHHFPKPYVALIDGITMGGGVGVSISASHRIVTDRTLFAMPETGIGLIPDVGGSWFLPRLMGGLGNYLGLTGARLSGADCVYTGIGTHFVAAPALAELRSQLLASEASKFAIDSVLAPIATMPISALSQSQEMIDRFFTDIDSLAALVAGLEAARSEAASQEFVEKTLSVISRLSPSSLDLSLEILKRGGALSFNECLRMEFRIVSRLMAGSDFHEGVRALIIDKDKSPKWSPATIEALDRANTIAMLEQLGDSELKLPSKP